jgi:enterochelin esterase-like enzyme
MKNLIMRVFILAWVSVFIQSCVSADDRPEGASITWVNEPTEKQLPLPPGTQHLTFHSDIVGKDIGYCVYLPPNYDKDESTRYPVIYNLHGNGGNEFTSLDSIQLLHKQIEAGITPPLIMVLANGGHSTFYKDSADGRFPIESIFVKEFIPHVDSAYRTIAERGGRCIEGFSMGGRGSTRLAVKYPDLFCSLFCQAGNVPQLLEIYDSAPVETRSKLLLGPDRKNWEEDDVYAVSKKNKSKLKNLRIQIACGTKDGGHLPTVRRFHQHLVELGIDHTYIELEGLAHKRNEMMSRMEPIWFAYHVESLYRSGALDRKK